MTEGVRPGAEREPASCGVLLSADLWPLSAVSEGEGTESTDQLIEEQEEEDEEEWGTDSDEDDDWDEDDDLTSEQEGWEDEGSPAY